MAEIINNVTFLYTKIRKPVFKYGSTTDSEWSVDCVISKAEAKKWKKAFPKNKVKEFDNDEFVEKFKVEVPFPDQDEQYIIKVMKDCVKGDWVTPEKYRPRVIVQENGKNVDKTFDILVANGSKGSVSYTLREVKGEQFPQLSAILVTDLIEYVSNSMPSGSEFCAEIKAVPAGNDNVPVVKQDDKNDSKPSKASAQEADIFEDEDVPF